jgi:transposase-like protein
MKKSRFSEQQIAFILKQAEDGTTVEEVCRKAGISIQAYYRWRINVRCGGAITTRSIRTAPSATKPRRSALLHQGRLACPDAKRAGLSHNDRTKQWARLKATMH